MKSTRSCHMTPQHTKAPRAAGYGIRGFTNSSDPWEAGFAKLVLKQVDLSRFRAAPCARLSHVPFEGDRAFPPQC